MEATIGFGVKPFRLFGELGSARFTLCETPCRSTYVNTPVLNWAVGTRTFSVSVVRKRCHSLFTKKKVLFLMMGPPTENPNWLRTYGFWASVAPVTGSILWLK